MIQKVRTYLQWKLPVMVGIGLLSLLVAVSPVSAIERLPDPDPKPGSYGIEATKPKPPPEVGATVSVPGNNAAFTNSPVTLSGICPTDDLLVQAYNNDVLVGSVMCTNGSFSLEITLFAGTNELSTIVYDELDQPGPRSNVVTVNYTNTQFTAFGELVTLTSAYGRRSASAGTDLTWPLQLSGGSGPYALSIDWGDGSPTELKSQGSTGNLTINHAYKQAGIYRVSIQVTDANGVSAFLQLVAVSSGQVDPASLQATRTITAPPEIIWIPAAIAVILLLPTYWLGRRSQLISLRNKMLKERDEYAKKKQPATVFTTRPKNT